MDINDNSLTLAAKLNSEWPRRPSLHMSPLQWKSHVELLRSFSNCAYQARQGVPVSVPEHRSASLASGTKGNYFTGFKKTRSFLVRSVFFFI